MTAQRRAHVRYGGGNVTFLMICITVFLLIPIGLCIWHFVWLLHQQQRVQAALDAAALQTANDLSRITINDPNFGFIAIANAPPIGSGTLAANEKPLAVEGYNTLIGTVRLDSLIARQLNDDHFKQLAQYDADRLEQVTNELNAALLAAIRPNATAVRPNDWDAKAVDAYHSARAIFVQNLGLKADAPELSRFQISLGRVKNASGTGIRIPQPSELALLPKQYSRSNYYLPYVDFPVDDEHFVFAGVGGSSSLCSASDFIPPAPKQLSTVVLAEASVNMNEPSILSSLLSALHITGASTISAASCAKPGSLPDQMPAGVLTVQFANGQVGGVSHLRYIITASQLKSAQAETYTAQFGNYPDDANSQLVRDVEDKQSALYSADGAFSTALYDWLRGQHCRPNILAVDHILDYNFKDQTQRLVSIFEFAPNGELVVHSAAISPFSANTVAENQIISQCSTNMGFPCIMIIRNQVYRLGTINGGKAGGQPLVGDPVNWCELPEFGGSSEEASRTGKGTKALNITVVGPPSNNCRNALAVSPFGAEFQDCKGRRLTTQPNPNYYSGGLAVDILIGVTNH